jgi:uncharacterized membrane protein
LKVPRRRWLIAGMLVSLAFMIFVSQFSWMEIVDGNPVQRRVFWPWYTLIGTCVTLLTAFILDRVHRVIAPR